MAFKFHGFDFLHLEGKFHTKMSGWFANCAPVCRGQPGSGHRGLLPRGRFPRELVPHDGGAGLLWRQPSRAYGCAGMSNVEYGLVMQELERGDSGFRSFVSVQSALVMYPIYTFGSDEQKNKWLPELAAGRSWAALG